MNPISIFATGIRLAIIDGAPLNLLPMRSSDIAKGCVIRFRYGGAF